MRAVCLRLGNVVNQTELARDVGISQPTVLRHLNTLEASYQLVQVPAYAVNRTKRLIKTPKVYWTDTGLAMYLAGELHPRGCHLENLLLSDLIAWNGPGRGADIMYWRTTTREGYRKSALPALLLHTGNNVKWIANGVLATPWWKVI